MPRFHDAISESFSLQSILRMTILAILLLVVGVVSGIVIGYKTWGNLSYVERRSIAIDFMRNGTWRYTLCNTPMDSIKPTKGENNEAR